ncbi:MAG: CYTH domain-containing protein [Chloroflexota bacterium]|nr:CYTH domain-containing protein [Chloroflexota bacterium]
MEVEAKLALTAPTSPHQIEALDWTPYQLGPRHDVQQHDTFFDTADLALSKTRHAVRLREGGVTMVVTLKGPGKVAAGVHEREELELPTAAREPDGWPEEVRAQLRRLIGDQPIQRLLEVRNHRHTWALLHSGQTIGEVALDKGQIIANNRSEPMHELEIELKGGLAEGLVLLSQLVQQQLPAQPEDRSKFARGLALLGIGISEAE